MRTNTPTRCAVAATMIAATIMVIPNALAAPSCFGRKATIVGTGGGDEIVGSRGSDVIVAKGGGDVIWGRGGKDYICANGGDDAVYAGGGADSINGSKGSDVLLGEKGDDSVKGGSGDDLLLGQGGDDVLRAGAGHGDALDYELSGNGVQVDLKDGKASGEGKDKLSGFEIVYGSPRGDTIKGTPDTDYLYGLEGNDTLNGRGGSDLLLGEDGGDTLEGGSGPELDTASFYFSSQRVIVNLAAGTASGEGGDELSGIEVAEGSQYDDVLTGDEKDNVIFAGRGADDIDGAAGSDTLIGDKGADEIEGGTGVDLVTYFYSDAAVDVSLLFGTASGGEGDDDLTGIEAVEGSADGDTIMGDNNANILYGYSGPDSLTGLGGDDEIYGDTGADLLDGGDGTDFEDGGPGTDECLNGEQYQSCETVTAGLASPSGRDLAPSGARPLRIRGASINLGGELPMRSLDATSAHRS